MNKLEFNYNDCNISLLFNDICILVDDHQVANDIGDDLANIWGGSTKNVFFNNQLISKKDFIVNVVDFKSSISDELKLSSKSILTQYLKYQISELDTKVIDTALNAINNNLELLNNEIAIDSIFNDNRISSSLRIDNLFDIIKANLKLERLENLSNQEQNTLLVKLLSFSIMGNQTILILQNFDIYDLSEMLEIMEIVSRNNVLIFIVTSNADFIETVYKMYPVYIVKHRFKELKALYELVLEEKYNHINQEQNILFFDDKEFNLIKINFEIYYLHYFIIYLTAKNKAIIRNVLLKSDDFRRKIVDILDFLDEMLE